MTEFTVVASLSILTCGGVAGFALWTTYKLRLVMALAIERRAREQNVALGIDVTVPDPDLVRPTPDHLHQ